MTYPQTATPSCMAHDSAQVSAGSHRGSCPVTRSHDTMMSGHDDVHHVNRSSHCRSVHGAVIRGHRSQVKNGFSPPHPSGPGQSIVTAPPSSQIVITDPSHEDTHCSTPGVPPQPAASTASKTVALPMHYRHADPYALTP